MIRSQFQARDHLIGGIRAENRRRANAWLQTIAGDPGLAFYQATTVKNANREFIFIKDYLTAKDKRHNFSYDNIVRGVREDNLSSSNITPSITEPLNTLPG